MYRVQGDLVAFIYAPHSYIVYCSRIVYYGLPKLRAAGTQILVNFVYKVSAVQDHYARSKFTPTLHPRTPAKLHSNSPTILHPTPGRSSTASSPRRK